VGCGKSRIKVANDDDDFFVSAILRSVLARQLRPGCAAYATNNFVLLDGSGVDMEWLLFPPLGEKREKF
jgi:hypothetical protein